MQVFRDRLAQGSEAGRVRIAMLAVAQRLDRRLDDVGRGFEIRLADAEIDDVAALSLQRRRLRQHGEGVLLADALEGGVDGDSHGLASRGRRPFWQSRGARASLAAAAPDRSAESDARGPPGWRPPFSGSDRR